MFFKEIIELKEIMVSLYFVTWQFCGTKKITEIILWTAAFRNLYNPAHNI